MSAQPATLGADSGVTPVAIVTGGAQGLGRAFAQRLLRDGYHVVIADRNTEAARRWTQDHVRPEALRVVGCDVADEGSVQGLVDETVAAFGRIDVLVNNAAIFSTLTMRPFEQIPPDEWDQLMAVNVRGVFLCCRAVSPVMRENGWGRIINIGSGATLLGRPNYLHYVTSKAALWGMTRSLATELGPDGITVNLVSPGAMETEIPRETVTEEQVERIIGLQAVKRRGTPADVVGVVSFLASHDSAFVTGQVINADGGAAYY